MNVQDKLNEHLQILVGKQLNAINLACEMMMFGFEEYSLHAQCFTRIICQDDILVTTLDYQSWDGKDDRNNDEWYYVEHHREKMTGGIVENVIVSALHDVVIRLDNGIRIELFAGNGYHHYDDEHEQWAFFKRHDHAFPFVTVYSKSVDAAEKW